MTCIDSSTCFCFNSYANINTGITILFWSLLSRMWGPNLIEPKELTIIFLHCIKNMYITIQTSLHNYAYMYTHIISYHIISYHIILYHVKSCKIMFLLCKIMLYHKILVLDHIISIHIKLDYITNSIIFYYIT